LGPSFRLKRFSRLDRGLEYRPKRGPLSIPPTIEVIFLFFVCNRRWLYVVVTGWGTPGIRFPWYEPDVGRDPASRSLTPEQGVNRGTWLGTDERIHPTDSFPPSPRISSIPNPR